LVAACRAVTAEAPHGDEAGGAGSEKAKGLRCRSDALLVLKGQSFLDNVIADFGPSRSSNDVAEALNHSMRVNWLTRLVGDVRPYQAGLPGVEPRSRSGGLLSRRPASRRE